MNSSSQLDRNVLMNSNEFGKAPDTAGGAIFTGIVAINKQGANSDIANDDHDEIVPCSYCNQPTYEESYILLSCLHRYHYSCVLNNISAVTPNGDFMMCKVCGFKSAVLGKTGLPVARDLGLISSKNTLGSIPKIPCSTCQFRISTVYCIDCCEGFCSKCAREFHNSVSTLQSHIIRQLDTNNDETVQVNSAIELVKAAKEEKILSGINGTEGNISTKQVQKKKKQSAEEYCIVHKQTEAKYFCLTCEHNCFCEVCATVGMHRDHKVLMANEAIDCIRDILGKFQHFAIKRISELDSVQDSTSEWKKQQQSFLEEVKPQLETNSSQACQILNENISKFKNELLKEWFDSEDIILKEINDAKKKHEEVKQLIASLHICLDKNDDYFMMNFLHDKYKEVYIWLDKPFNEGEFSNFTDPVVCYERVYNMTDRMNRETANLISQQIALNRLSCIFQPRKFQCNFESDIITFDDDGIAIPVLSSEKISYSSSGIDENIHSDKSIIKIRGELFNDNIFSRKKQDIQIEKSVSLEIIHKEGEDEFEDNSYDALYEKMAWLHPSSRSINEEHSEINGAITEEIQFSSEDDIKFPLDNISTHNKNNTFHDLKTFSNKVFTDCSEDESFVSNLCFDLKNECINTLPRFDILYSRENNPFVCK
ncbi:B-box zinc finger domain-containing [Cryptosporidium sp. chipmunk genotype I]|uniref:B-box zinc finger domain-containing n=1 Tax=Cryptosporidium sp. chipmunk genotype I TaxID=1280935 RepID=UPI00351A33B2|nr:B-box zinc finger domain-containing [Cryptosporidium sp. chipmunk genotype I]